MDTVPICVKLYDFFERVCYSVYVQREWTAALRSEFVGPPLYMHGRNIRM